MILIYLVFILFSVGGNAFVFSAHLNVTQVDLRRETLQQVFPNESLILLHNYGTHLLFGGRNVAYNVSVSSSTIAVSRIFWNVTKQKREDCKSIDTTGVHCENYITSFYSTRNGFVLCGTYALRPTCAEFEGASLQRTFSGTGISPFRSSFRSPFLTHRQHLYTASVTDFSGSDALLLRKNISREDDFGLRTPRQGVAFEEPKFVKLHENGNEILLWFTEAPSERDSTQCGMRAESHVARVCARDSGGRRPYENEWSSYVKSRVECAIQERDQDTLYFNQMEDIFPSNHSIYGVFRSQLAGLGASAICAFDRKEISYNFKRMFEGSNSSECARATTQEQHTFIRNNPMNHRKLERSPVFVHNGEDRFTSIVVEEEQMDLDRQSFDVMWIGTDRGNIFKVIRREGSLNATQVAVMKIANSTIKQLSLHRLPRPNRQFSWRLIALTDTSLHRTPASVCHSALSCSDCLSLGDPHCAWVEFQCVPTYENMNRRAYMHQNPKRCEISSPTTTTSTTESPPTRNNPMNMERKKEIETVSTSMIRQRDCLCESQLAQEAKLCSTEVIQKEVHAKVSYWPYVFFGVLGFTLGTAVNMIITKYIMIPTLKTPPSPIRYIDAFSDALSHSNQTSMTYSHSSADKPANASCSRSVSKQTYC